MPEDDWQGEQEQDEMRQIMRLRECIFNIRQGGYLDEANEFTVALERAGYPVRETN